MKPVLILMGPTGVGKTGASILLAKELKTEIISADSMQIFRGMDIGTAKPGPDERQGVVHHMIDIVEPTEAFSTGRYIETIVPIIEALHKKGKIPLIVGGTGLYIKAITRGIFSGPSADWGLREELMFVESRRPGSLYSRLTDVDPESAGKIEKNDTRRVLRALEVFMKKQKKMSSLQQSLTRPLPYGFVKIGLTRDRKELYRLIDMRVDSMVRAGLIDEVKEILNRSPDKTPLQAIGYKEFVRHFRGEITRDDGVTLVKRNSRRFAKRQFTWFKKETEVNWIDITGLYDSGSIFRALRPCVEDLMAKSREGRCADLRLFSGNT